MDARLKRALRVATMSLLAGPAMAQVSVLDSAQDAAEAAAAPVGPCGARALSIARMGWPSAEILAEIHARLLVQEFDCEVQVTPGDLAATASSMGSSGQPAIAPEMWVTRVADLWNAGIEAQMFRPASPSYAQTQFEGWFIPDYVAATAPDLTAASGLAAALPVLGAESKVRFISCPPDWACAVINRNLIAAYGLTGLVEIVEPANRFEMDTLIAEAVSRKEPVLFYYWQPNAVLAQLSFVPLDMGAYEAEAAKCLAQLACSTPVPTAFTDETVITALSEWVFTDAPAVAGYFQRASLPLEEMNQMLAQLNEPGMTVEAVADRFIAERRDVWSPWVGGLAN